MNIVLLVDQVSARSSRDYTHSPWQHPPVLCISHAKVILKVETFSIYTTHKFNECGSAIKLQT